MDSARAVRSAPSSAPSADPIRSIPACADPPYQSRVAFPPFALPGHALVAREPGGTSQPGLNV
eukprot:12846091-Alexandrium_andersonii.AAC.1